MGHDFQYQLDCWSENFKSQTSPTRSQLSVSLMWHGLNILNIHLCTNKLPRLPSVGADLPLTHTHTVAGWKRLVYILKWNAMRHSLTSFPAGWKNMGALQSDLASLLVVLARPHISRLISSSAHIHSCEYNVDKHRQSYSPNHLNGVVDV